MKILQYAMLFIILTGIGMLYDRYKRKLGISDNKSNEELIERYLLNRKDSKKKKPIIWVHSKTEINSRNWLSFGSRNSRNLNQNYIILTIQSIIKHCGDNFHVCLITDDSFEKLLPEWNFDLNKIADPIRERMRLFGILKLLHKYGGINIPDSMIMVKDMKPLYDEMMRNNDMIVGEFLSRNVRSFEKKFTPSCKLIGCKKESENVDELLDLMRVLISSDSTSEMDFNGDVEKKLEELCCNSNVQLLSGKSFGIKNCDGDEILLEDLISDNDLNLCKDLYGVYVNKEELLKRTHMNWFARLNMKEILESNTNLGNNLLVSLGK